MTDDLGARLLRAGLATRDQVASALASGAGSAGALVAALVARGVPEDAIAGFFVAEGFGPLADDEELGRGGEPTDRFPPAMAVELLALPLRSSAAGLVVAMAAPSDRHALREIGRAVGTDVMATVARVGSLRAALQKRHPALTDRLDALSAPPPLAESEPPVLELVRRKPEVEIPITVEEDEPVLLTRTRPTPALGTARGTPALPPVRPGRITSGFGDDKLRAASRDAATRSLGTLSQDRPTAEYPAYRETPAPSPAPAARSKPAANTRTTTPLERVDSSADAPLPASSRATMPLERIGARRSTTEPHFARVSSLPPLEEEAPTREWRASSSTRTDLLEVAETRELATRELPIEGTRELAVEPEARVAIPVRDAVEPLPGDRWDLGPSVPTRPSTRPGARAPSSVRRPPPDLGPTFAAIRAAQDRDEVVRRACEGALTVARVTVLLALQRGVLRGWDGAGPGMSRDAVRSLWIPATSPSALQRAIETEEPWTGPYGTSVADGLFRAAVGSRGGEVAVHPISVSGRVVALLCADEPMEGPAGAARLAQLANAVAEALSRILSGRRG